jgi:SNF2 family DNA or RNA helicase
MENTLVDLWSLGDLAVPGILGSLHEFTSRYPDTESGASDLSSFIDTIILKRQVKDVASDLPERTDIDIPIDLDDASRNEYIRIKNEVIAEYGAAGRLVAVGQLALFCAHPWLRQAVPQPIDFDTQDELDMNTPFPLVTEKVELCISLLHEAFLHKRKVLVFASFNHCAEILEKAATKLDMPSAYWNTINGSTPADDRQVIIDEYSNHSGPAVLVMNPRAAGAGLNITAATIVIHYTQNWNPALEMQASARAHRRGQAMPVTIYRLYYQGTVEETMVERSRWKRELGDLAVPLSTRDDEDFSNALSLSPTKEDILCPTNNIRKC